MSGIILYQSKYGATKKYALWLAEETGFLVKETKTVTAAELKPFDTILLGGGIYASGIAGLSFLKKNLSALQGKKLLVFCVGASPYDENAFRELTYRNLTGPLKDIPCFYCRGAWTPETMTMIDRNLCKMLQKSLAKRPPESLALWEKALLEAGNTHCDWTDRHSLEPILKAL